MNSALRTLHSELHRSVERALKYGPRTGQQLVDQLGVSQPTLSRTIRDMASTVVSYRLKGIRSPFYALLRTLPFGISPRQKIFRFLSAGHIVPYADVEFLAGGGTLERSGNSNYYYEGLPPYMSFAAPSGFLGRQVAHTIAREHAFPSSLKDWNDDHRVAYLFTQGLNLPGNLVFGDAPLQRELDLIKHKDAMEVDDKLTSYSEMAQQLKHASYGSSAGGEQPKFLSMRQDTGHVIVKFARIGSRMADLLPLEHLALRSLANVGVPTAKTQIMATEEFVFLEVARFDRVGATGRVGMLSAGAVDDEFFGARDTWPEFAARCVEAGYLSKQDAQHVCVMAAFSELIGNTDRHFENISMLIGDDGEYRGIAPGYDILPMRYASIGGGIDPDLQPIEPKVGTIGANTAVWALAARAADEFWRAVECEHLSAPVADAIRELAKRNRQVAQAFAAPLLPAA